jgi:hypothetical protein
VKGKIENLLGGYSLSSTMVAKKNIPNVFLRNFFVSSQNGNHQWEDVVAKVAIIRNKILAKSGF